MDIALIKLIIFIVWIGVIMFLAARPGVKAFNREFVALILTAALLFYQAVSQEIFATALLAYLGVRTYQKKINSDKNSS